MISPRAYLQARQNVVNEKTSVPSGRRRSSKSPKPITPPSTVTRNSLTTHQTRTNISRPSPSPITSPSTQHDSNMPRSQAEHDSMLLERQSSQPVTIPVKKAATTNQIPKSVPVRRMRRRNNDEHEGASVPPAVAALLATTAIPPPKARPGRLMKANSSMTRRISIEQLRNEWKKDAGTTSSSLGVGSPLDFLLGPHDVQDTGNPLISDGLDSDAGSFTTASRSMSSESILSTPSLENDIGTYSSINSSFATPTPSWRRGSKLDRKVCSPPAEICQDHPLIATAIMEESSASPTPVPSSPPSAEPTSKSRFKFTSNLTLSFQALRSAAKSFSNFTAPSIPSDDFLTRSLFANAQRYAPEMRPKSFESVPDPAVRRYFNPMPALSSPDFHSMLTDALGSKVAESAVVKSGEAAAPMIPMQTYSRSNRRPRRQSVEREESSFVARSMTRQREPRENSDFLRVIVLEMNMRRVGKLDAKTGGRARIWLPPRQNSAPSPLPHDVQRTIPSRWIAVTVDDDDD